MSRIEDKHPVLNRIGLIKGCFKDDEEYSGIHTETLSEIIDACIDLYAEYKMMHAKPVREALMKEGVMFPETQEEVRIFEEHNSTEDIECPISAEEMLDRIKTQ